MSSFVLRKRKGDLSERIEKIARTMTPAPHLLSIPSDFIIQFLEPEDRLPLAATCKDLLRKVEGFCERIFGKVVEISDKTFKRRLAKNKKYPFRIKLLRCLSIPLDRHLFEKGIDRDFPKANKVRSFSISPSEAKCLVRRPYELEIYDFATRNIVASMNIRGLWNRRTDLECWFLTDTKVILCDENRELAVWDSETGLFRFILTAPNLSPQSTLSIDENQFLIAREKPNQHGGFSTDICKFNLADGSTVVLFTERTGGVGFIGLMAENLLVVENILELTVAVYDIRNFEKKSETPFVFSARIPGSNSIVGGEKYFFSKKRKHILLELDHTSGTFSKTPLFEEEGTIVAASESSIILHSMKEKKWNVFGFRPRDMKRAVGPDRNLVATPTRTLEWFVDHGRCAYSSKHKCWYISTGIGLEVYLDSEPRIAVTDKL